MPDFPPTIFVVHPREKRGKCTIEPLRGTNGFEFWTFPHREKGRLGQYVRLGIGGPQLSAADHDRGLLILDGTWRLAERMEPFYAEAPVRSLPPDWVTAYPRVSKLFNDPVQGLATIEALYAAYILLGRNTQGLLDHYRWKAEFLARNRSLETPPDPPLTH